MGFNPIISPQLNQSKHQNLEFEDAPHDYIFHVRQSWFQELGSSLAFLYAVITSLSSKEGFCFMKDTSFARMLNLSLPSVERSLNLLQKKKWIFRNTFSIGRGKGTKRYIITRDHAVNYWKKYLSKPQVPLKVKEKFILHFFGNEGVESVMNMDPLKTMGEPFTPLKIDGSIRPIKNDGSISYGNKIENKIQRRIVPSAPDFSSIEKELTIAKIEGEQKTVAKNFYLLFRAIIEKKDNPVGFLIWAVKTGKAADMLEQHAAVQEDNLSGIVNFQSNKKAAHRVYEELKDMQVGFQVKLTEIYIVFYFGSSGLPIGWHEKDFSHLLKKARAKAYECYRNSHQSHSLETSPA